MLLGVLWHLKHLPLEVLSRELITPSHSWGHPAIPQELCDIQPAQLNTLCLTCNHQVTLSPTWCLSLPWQLISTGLWFQPSIFCWWLWLQVLLALFVWSGCLVLYSLTRFDESPTEANGEIPIDSVLDGGQENCSVLLFLVTIHVASPFINCILFIHPGTSTTEFSHTNSSRCPRQELKPWLFTGTCTRHQSA